MRLKSLLHSVPQMLHLTSALTASIWMVLRQTPSAAMANAVSVDFGTNTSTLQNKLNTLMTTLNGAHPEAVFEYSIDASSNSVTFKQRDGGGNTDRWF